LKNLSRKDQIQSERGLKDVTMDEMNPNEHKWATQAGLEGLFNIQWITP
jgi:hypothetical protein